LVGYPRGQRGQTVNLLAYAFAGSNPAPTTIFSAGKNAQQFKESIFFRLLKFFKAGDNKIMKVAEFHI
jgi:hypothetical protein